MMAAATIAATAGGAVDTTFASSMGAAVAISVESEFLPKSTSLQHGNFQWGSHLPWEQGPEHHCTEQCLEERPSGTVIGAAER
jgi:hypothetical protein